MQPVQNIETDKLKILIYEGVCFPKLIRIELKCFWFCNYQEVLDNVGNLPSTPRPIPHSRGVLCKRSSACFSYAPSFWPTVVGSVAVAVESARTLALSVAPAKDVDSVAAWKPNCFNCQIYFLRNVLLLLLRLFARWLGLYVKNKIKKLVYVSLLLVISFGFFPLLEGRT